MPSPLTELLRELARTFSRAGVDWYLFGAQAAILYGAARLSADVDVTVELGSTKPAHLVERLREAGFSSRVADPVAFGEETRIIPLLHDSSGIPVDVVLAGSDLERRFFVRVRRLSVEGTELPVASPEDVIVMKVLAGRAKDLEDAEAVAHAAAGDLDLAYVRATLRELEEGLERSDLIPELDRVLERAEISSD